MSLSPSLALGPVSREVPCSTSLPNELLSAERLVDVFYGAFKDILK